MPPRYSEIVKRGLSPLIMLCGVWTLWSCGGHLQARNVGAVVAADVLLLHSFTGQTRFASLPVWRFVVVSLPLSHLLLPQPYMPDKQPVFMGVCLLCTASWVSLQEFCSLSWVELIFRYFIGHLYEIAHG